MIIQSLSSIDQKQLTRQCPKSFKQSLFNQQTSSGANKNPVKKNLQYLLRQSKSLANHVDISLKTKVQKRTYHLSFKYKGKMSIDKSREHSDIEQTQQNPIRRRSIYSSKSLIVGKKIKLSKSKQRPSQNKTQTKNQLQKFDFCLQNSKRSLHSRRIYSCEDRNSKRKNSSQKNMTRRSHNLADMKMYVSRIRPLLDSRYSTIDHNANQDQTNKSSIKAINLQQKPGLKLIRPSTSKIKTQKEQFFHKQTKWIKIERKCSQRYIDDIPLQPW